MRKCEECINHIYGITCGAVGAGLFTANIVHDDAGICLRTLYFDLGEPRVTRCAQAREEGGFCGPEGKFFVPKGNNASGHVFPMEKQNEPST